MAKCKVGRPPWAPSPAYLPPSFQLPPQIRWIPLSLPPSLPRLAVKCDTAISSPSPSFSDSRRDFHSYLELSETESGFALRMSDRATEGAAPAARPAGEQELAPALQSLAKPPTEVRAHRNASSNRSCRVHSCDQLAPRLDGKELHAELRYLPKMSDPATTGRKITQHRNGYSV